MTESILLRQIEEANKSYRAGTPRLLDPAGEPFLVLTCIDPRLTGFLESALGLPRHRAVMIRTAGNQISAHTPDVLRSIAAALYIKNAREIVVAGHTDCALANFSAAAVAENFRQAGIPRTAFGDQDLRTWFGAFGSVRDNLIASIDYLRNSALVPREVKVHGLIFDTEKGSFEVVVDGNVVRASPTPSVMDTEDAKSAPAADESPDKKTAAEPPAAVKAPAAPAPTAPPPAAKKGPVIVGEPAAKTGPAPAPTDSLLEAALVLRDFFHRERQNQQLQKGVANLRMLWRQEKSPVRIFQELQKLSHAYRERYPNLPGALLYLENAVKTGSADRIGFGELLRRMID
jgi:carbonic anhydrase